MWQNWGAGDVIGYMGRAGYGTEENVNNIDTYHLHFGLQLIFDESQREGNHEIWVDVYPLVSSRIRISRKLYGMMR